MNKTNKTITDHGPCPFVTDIEKLTIENDYFRVALWTGCYLQVTLMSVPSGQDIGCELHEETDQFLRIEEGMGKLIIGCDDCDYQTCTNFRAGDALFIPAGTWHNVVNTGNCPLKLYSIYAPPHHPHGTVQRTKNACPTHDNPCGCTCK